MTVYIKVCDVNMKYSISHLTIYRHDERDLFFTGVQCFLHKSCLYILFFNYFFFSNCFILIRCSRVVGNIPGTLTECH